MSISSHFSSAAAFKNTIMNVRFDSSCLLFLIFFYAYQSIITRILAHILLVQTRYYNGFQLYLSKPQVGRNPADPILRGVSHVRICRFHDSFWHRFGPSCTHGHLYGDFDTNFSLEGRLAGRSHRSDRSISGVGHFPSREFGLSRCTGFPYPRTSSLTIIVFPLSPANGFYADRGARGMKTHGSKKI